MFSTADTIVAIATPPGRGGLGVVRLSGPDAVRVASALVDRGTTFKPRHATYARLLKPAPTSVGDEVVVTCFPSPASYTGEDVVEISAHGSPVVLAGILRAATGRGARLAEPGEFTLRAFLHGKRDLVQAEAVADLIDAVTPLQARAAFDQLEGTLTGVITAIDSALFDLIARLEASLDFPDEGYHFVEPNAIGGALDGVVARLDRLLADAGRGRLVREGAQVVIVGAPNVGKSSLFNALLNTNRAIVTAVPGTTRDVLTERADIHGLSLALLDTAGIRDTEDEVEREGVARSHGTLAVSDLALVVLDRSRPLDEGDGRVLDATSSRRRLVVINKTDLPDAWDGREGDVRAEEAIEISTRTGAGLDQLADRIVSRLADGELQRDPPAVTNVRHVTLLEEARRSLEHARAAYTETAGTLPEEFLIADLQEARHRLEEVTGRRSAEDVLRHIFEKFCVGK
jgi:tRNA modification GTPase